MEMRLGPSDAYVSEPVVQFVITLEAQAQNEEAHARLGALIPELVVAACGEGRVPVAQNLRELAKLIPFRHHSSLTRDPGEFNGVSRGARVVTRRHRDLAACKVRHARVPT
jgi:hypothetical protein